MMRKLAVTGYRVAPLYRDEPSGTIVEVIDDLNVGVLWDGDRFPNKEPIKFLRKGFTNDAVGEQNNG